MPAAVGEAGRQSGAPAAPRCRSAAASGWNCSRTQKIGTAACRRRASLAQTLCGGSLDGTACESTGWCSASGCPLCGRSPPTAVWRSPPAEPKSEDRIPVRRRQAALRSPAGSDRSVGLSRGFSCMEQTREHVRRSRARLHLHRRQKQLHVRPCWEGCRGRTDQERLRAQQWSSSLHFLKTGLFGYFTGMQMMCYITNNPGFLRFSVKTPGTCFHELQDWVCEKEK